MRQALTSRRRHGTEKTSTYSGACFVQHPSMSYIDRRLCKGVLGRESRYVEQFSRWYFEASRRLLPWTGFWFCTKGGAGWIQGLSDPIMCSVKHLIGVRSTGSRPEWLARVQGDGLGLIRGEGAWACRSPRSICHHCGIQLQYYPPR
jgi:hypothetical protein